MGGPSRRDSSARRCPAWTGRTSTSSPANSANQTLDTVLAGLLFPRYLMSRRSSIVTRVLLLEGYMWCMVFQVGDSVIFGQKGYGRCECVAEVREGGNPVHKAK